MEVNTNFSARGLSGVAPQRTFAAAAKTPAAADPFANSSALENAVQDLPASRPDAVAGARELIADPDYPSPAVLRQISSLLAEHLTSDDQ
jgi:hypothetical protein